MNNNIKCYLIPSLKDDQFLILLEILFTNSINWDNLNKDIDKYGLRDIESTTNSSGFF